MATSAITRLASAAVVTGVASLALAAPASAALPTDPEVGNGVSNNTSTDSGWEVAQIATGAIGGIALVGAGVAAVAGLRRRNEHFAHPA